MRFLGGGASELPSSSELAPSSELARIAREQVQGR